MTVLRATAIVKKVNVNHRVISSAPHPAWTAYHASIKLSGTFITVAMLVSKIASFSADLVLSFIVSQE